MTNKFQKLKFARLPSFVKKIYYALKEVDTQPVISKDEMLYFYNSNTEHPRTYFKYRTDEEYFYIFPECINTFTSEEIKYYFDYGNPIEMDKQLIIMIKDILDVPYNIKQVIIFPFI